MNKLTPVETYSPPSIPTLANKPPLRQLPKRWAKNAAVVACIGMLGASTLLGTHAANSPEPTTRYTQTATRVLSASTRYSDLDINVRMHSGGSGSAFYVVHLTEQEMRNIVQAELEAAGLRPVPARFARLNVLQTLQRNAWIDDPDYRSRPVGIDLFDVRRRVGISIISWEHNNRPFFSWGDDYLARRYAEQFARHPALTLTTVGVFYNPGVATGSGGWTSDWEWTPLVPPTEKQLTAAMPVLVAQVQLQVQNFLADTRLARPIEHGLDFTIQRDENERYTLQLTEQKALEIIHAELEAAGLDLTRSDVAIALQHNAWQLETRTHRGTTTGVFGNPSHVWWSEISEAQAADSAFLLQARLIGQAHAFIHYLQSEGIL